MKGKGPLVVHLFFWLIILGILLWDTFSGNQTPSRYEVAVKLGYFAVINLSIFYINYTLLIPILIEQKKRYGLYVLSICLLIAVMVIIKTVVASLNSDFFLTYFSPDTGQIEYYEITKYVIFAIFVSGFFVVVSALLKFAIDWFGSERIQRDLVSEKRDMELQFLKSQLNPHFLFNSLNNIYSLAYQKSDKTADAILKLSEIMRYMIYESNDSWVSLSKEITYVQSYIELQKLRFKDGAAVEFTVNGEIDDQPVVPLILISFVENAFKHGVANDPKDPIRINIIANQKILHFSISNKKNKHNKDQMGGVGLNNVERRLQLLYPDRYKLNIVNSATHYTSELMLDI
ncbi:two-component system LytT family sensor kinase [Pedobacter africanus]|uniref:Two-component sensor histidine kinase n=1 Tax=Pedobacter africanus TaxID=151894 RepID=A0ACC6L3F5_9SPHI|nr:sensor histidine kinase [Pedobacter africanus]MDR6785902.1 two-component sensor histidine kinase [Pedobacter africanus]